MQGFKLSTETKIGLLLFYTSTLTIPFTGTHEILSLLLVLLLLSSINKVKTGVKIIFAFFSLTGIYYLTSKTIGVAQVFHTWALIMRRLLIPFTIGGYFIFSTNVSSLMASMEKLKIPKVIIIPLIVMFRYFPELKNEYSHIKSAMKIRGIEHGLKAFMTPSLTLEHLLVPLLFSTSNIGEELSQAAFSKGISIEGKKNRYFETHLTKFDVLIAIYLIIFVYLLIRR
ncbi:energy-coupling factor transporter transmembrane component T [Facklamia miroungae]|uniref:Energy-coupling factor transport system permease protein n=1 Tax=Facklamia miroungae TaxID=120956 RepID=A0A1G7UAW0_9LACT|nr:energy-coupling factor transporter transmembrane component T [Facklamia miroungae]NKZ30038.1 energy-coupling factor transporter transmembrane protein EcfT [Facklamia miroungae]SDG44722.1 energy-coupling factor transport system permease protein [Facklamia miroungae]